MSTQPGNEKLGTLRRRLAESEQREADLLRRLEQTLNERVRDAERANDLYSTLRSLAAYLYACGPTQHAGALDLVKSRLNHQARTIPSRDQQALILEIIDDISATTDRLTAQKVDFRGCCDGCQAEPDELKGLLVRCLIAFSKFLPSTITTNELHSFLQAGSGGSFPGRTTFQVLDAGGGRSFPFAVFDRGV